MVLQYIDMNQPWVYMCPPIPNHPPSLPHPSGLSQCTTFECPASWTEFALLIYFTYGNIYISMLFSQIIPPPPSLTKSKSLFFISVSLCCLTYRVIVTIFLNSIYIYIYMCVCVCEYTVLVLFFLTYFTLYNRLQFHPPH